MMAIDYCDCGMPEVKEAKCLRCGKQISEKRLKILKNAVPEIIEKALNEDEDSEPYEYKNSLNKTIREGKVPLSTTLEIPGRTIAGHIALVTGVGNARFTLTGTNSRLTNRAASKAFKALYSEAERIEADAIVGVSLTIDTYGTGITNQLVVVTGTAVKLKK
jgi:uncharacterized protein YbjQ (UPF0145 family)